MAFRPAIGVCSLSSFLGRETIPSLVKPSPEMLAEIQLIENIQREDLSPADLEIAVKSPGYAPWLPGGGC